jgi:arabinan endo-1,5-alpha-L-arabinosidase
MKRDRFNIIKNLLCFILLLASSKVFTQKVDPAPFNDTLIGVHDPVIIRQDSTYYIFCTGRGISVFSSTDMKHWKQQRPVFDKVAHGC